MHIPVKHNHHPHSDASSFDPSLARHNHGLHWRRGKRSLTTDQAAKQITRENCKFYDRNGDGKISVGFNISHGFTGPQKARIREALKYWEDVAKISFVENGSNTDGHITINGVPGSSSGHAFLPSQFNSRVTATIGTWGGDGKPAIGSQFLSLVIHELGHTLGLSHPGEYDGWGFNYRGSAEYAQDTKARSVMSYWDETNQPGYNFNWHGPTAPMIDDIAASQRLYGKNLKTRDTDTTYGFNSNSGRELYSLKRKDDKPVFSIWDGGGNDTLDFSGFAQNQKINLNAEAFSDVGGLRGNVSVAKGVVVENAVGGSGDDTLTGNQANNRLKGGMGRDTLRGGAGADTFVYERTSDSTPQKPDIIEDFASGTDKIDICAVLKQAGLKGLNFSERLRGQAGDAVLVADAKTGGSTLSVDTTGNGQSDLTITSQSEIKSSDVISDGQESVVTPPVTTTTDPAATTEPTAETETETNTETETETNTTTETDSLRPVQPNTPVVTRFKKRIRDVADVFLKPIKQFVNTVLSWFR